MKSSINHSVRVLVSGFVVLLLLSLPLFWARWLCETILVTIMPRDYKEITLRPSGLVPGELENDPNVVKHSEVNAFVRTEESSFLVLGVTDYFQARNPGGRRSNIYYYDHEWGSSETRPRVIHWIYFDKKTGLLVCRFIYRRILPDETQVLRDVQLYAGPEGVSETADRRLGRFIAPMIDERLIAWAWDQKLTLYDKKLRRFFKINFNIYSSNRRTVIKGPQLSKNDLHEPTQIGLLRKNDFSLYLRWDPPMIKASRQEAREKGHLRKWDDDYIIPIVEHDYYPRTGQYLLVLDATGRIDLLDRETLEFAGTAGYLPAPQSLFPSKRYVTPKDLLAYDVKPLTFRPESNYRGIFTASVNRGGSAMALSVFGENGELLRKEYSKFDKYRGPQYRGPQRINVRSSKAMYFEVPWAPVLTISKYLLENLQPPILSVVSYFTADSIEAAAGHRALFILPNSFIAMMGRDVTGNMVGRFGLGFLFILPSIILSVLLAWRVGEDATVVGLSENARISWILATITFGLAAYITYRLTRPEITLVTCANCGMLRRPDMDRCHRCGSKWQVPELTPPTWRVVDNV